MSKVISFSLNSRSVGKAIRELRKYEKEVDQKTQTLYKRIVELLEERVRTGFNAAVADYFWMRGREGQGVYREDPDVSIGITDEGNARVVWASGKDAIFVEFGTGVHYNAHAGSSPHPLGDDFGYTIGSYGLGNGKKETWGFRRNGQTYMTHGIPAQMPMFNAAESVREEIYEIAKEVFRNG